MKRALRQVALAAFVLLGVGAVATAQTPDAKPPENSSFLHSLSGIQEWASNLEAALRKQGNEIDQRKAKDQLLPSVIAIQKSLSDLEDINTKVVADCGTSIETLNREQMAVDLYSLRRKIAEIQASFRDVREKVQIISSPEITAAERAGETGGASRGMEVYSALQILGYGDGNGGVMGSDPEVDYADLKARSDKITALLHQVQDSFGKLHAYLAAEP